MKKNNKGFFLAETIVVLALVTTVIAFVYPNVSKLYENYNTRIKYYDQTEDLLLLQEVYESYKDEIKNKVRKEDYCGKNYEGLVDINNGAYNINRLITRGNVNNAIEISDKIGDLELVYIANYMGNPRYEKLYGFNRYLKRLRKSSYDTTSYRLIGIFRKRDSSNNILEERYASIRIDNPFGRMCN